jgi:hypothetical protein
MTLLKPRRNGFLALAVATAMFAAISHRAFAQTPGVSPIPHPSLGPYAWVLIEIWPEVNDITLAAYFLANTSAKSQSLCEATKRSLDRDAIALAKSQNRQTTSYRRCWTVRDAIKAGYVAAE